MAFIDEMQNLRESIKSGKQIRSQRVKELREELSAFMKNASQKRKEDFKAFQEEVNKFIADLKKDVKETRKDVKETRKENRVKQQELKKMLAEAKAAFWGKKSKGKSKKGEES